MISRLGGDEWAPLPIELRGLKTLAGAACCKLVELPSYKAAPLQAGGPAIAPGFSFASIRLHSCPFAVAIRRANSTQRRIQVIIVGPLSGQNDFQWVFLKVWLSRLISEC